MKHSKSKTKCITKFCRNPRAPQRLICWRCKSRRAKNTVHYVLNIIRGRARRKGIEFSITLDQFRQWCETTGYLEKRGTKPESMTVGRINHDEGYHIGNIQPETHRYNSWMGHWVPPYLRV